MAEMSFCPINDLFQEKKKPQLKEKSGSLTILRTEKVIYTYGQMQIYEIREFRFLIRLNHTIKIIRHLMLFLFMYQILIYMLLYTCDACYILIY